MDNYRAVPYDYMKDEKVSQSAAGVSISDQMNANIAKLPDTTDDDEPKNLDATMFSIPDPEPRDFLGEGKLVVDDITVEEFERRQVEKEKQRVHDELKRGVRNTFIEKWSYKKVRMS